jgi:CD109 antigen
VILPSYATYNESDVVCSIKATYTYGKPVKGDVTLTVQPRVRYNMLTVRPLEQFQVTSAIDGTVDIPVSVVRNLNLKTDFFEREIEFFALVEESLTGRKYNKTGILKMYDKKIKIELVKTSKTFKPGLKYNIILKVSYQDDVPVQDNGPEVRVKYGYSYNEDTWNMSHTAVPDKGIISFDIIPPKSDAMVLGLRAEYIGQQYYLETIEAAQSPSSNFLQLTMSPPDQSPKVGSDVTFAVVATEPFNKIVYEVMGRGDIVLARSFLTDTNQHQFTFTVTHSMAPKSRIVSYYVRSDNQEVVADAVNFDVDGVFRTPVTLTTNVQETKPGSDVQVNVATKPGAFVAVLGLDQSILLLKTGNDVTQQDVMKELETYDGGKSSDGGFLPWNSKRRRRSLWWPGSVSAGEIFQDSGVILLSNGLVHRNFPASK